MSSLRYKLERYLSHRKLEIRHGWKSFVLAALMTLGVLSIGSRLVTGEAAAETPGEEKIVAGNMEIETQQAPVQGVEPASSPSPEQVASLGNLAEVPTTPQPETLPTEVLPSNQETLSAESPALSTEVVKPEEVPTSQTAPIEMGPPVPAGLANADSQHEPPSAPATNADEIQLATAVVTDFYAHLGSREWDLAYDALTIDFRQTLSYRRFCEGYGETETLGCQVKNSELLSPDKVRLDVVISVSEYGVPTDYLATCLVTKSADGAWLLEGVAQIKG